MRSSNGDVEPNGSSGKSDSNGTHDMTTRPSGSFFGHDREEVTRILIQSLTDLGYHGAATSLSRESGYELENPSVAAFRDAILCGEWNEAEALLFGSTHTQEDGEGGVTLKDVGDTQKRWSGRHATRSSQQGLPLSESANKKEMLFEIRQQKYLEFLEQRDIGSALTVLRTELTPNHTDTQHLHEITGLIMSSSAEEVKSRAGWDGAAGESRHQLLSELSKLIAPSVMIPEHRLAVLLDQVQSQQINQCLYHNTATPPSLYHDHSCEEAGFPSHVYETLKDHSDEVWYIEFSHDGTMLATASSDNTVNIYDTVRWNKIATLSDTRAISDVYGVCYLAWSPSDQYILACSRGNDLTIYDVKGGGRRLHSISDFSYPVTSAVWCPDGDTFVVGSHDTGKALQIYSLDQSLPMGSFSTKDEGLRVNDCSISGDGSRLAVVTNDKRVLVYDFHTRQRLSDWPMGEALTCVSLSQDGKTILVSANNSNLLLYEVSTGLFIRKYPGLKQNNFVIRSCFGGANENFVVSGSEDSRVYIWRKQTGALVTALDAHYPGTVNCVAWHPKNPAIWASAGDDKKVRIWSKAV